MSLFKIYNKVINILKIVFGCCRSKSIERIFKAIQSFLEDCVLPINSIKIGGNTYIHPTVNMKSADNIFIGSYVRIQPHVFLWASPNSKIVVGDFSGIGPGTKIFSSNHRYRFGEKYINQPWDEKDIVIGENVWIGAQCLIVAGIKIGDGAVVGAGSVVTRDVPPNCLAFGNPATIVREG